VANVEHAEIGRGGTRRKDIEKPQRANGDSRASQWPPLPNDMHAWGTVQADAQPSICRLADGVPARLARRGTKLKALGNAVVPACAEIVGRRIMELANVSP